jgi:hypothetical protein
MEERKRRGIPVMRGLREELDCPLDELGIRRINSSEGVRIEQRQIPFLPVRARPSTVQPRPTNGILVAINVMN